MTHKRMATAIMLCALMGMALMGCGKQERRQTPAAAFVSTGADDHWMQMK